MLVSQMSSVHVNLDPDTLHWTDGNMQSIYCNYLRLFYVEDGNATREVIGEWMGTKTIYYTGMMDLVLRVYTHVIVIEFPFK